MWLVSEAGLQLLGWKRICLPIEPSHLNSGRKSEPKNQSPENSLRLALEGEENPWHLVSMGRPFAPSLFPLAHNPNTCSCRSSKLDCVPGPLSLHKFSCRKASPTISNPFNAHTTHTTVD